MSLLQEMFDGSPEPLNERPYSRTQSAIDSTKGKVKGMFGSGQIEQGAQDAGKMANQLWSDFKRYVGRKYGSNQSSIPFGDVATFFKGNNLDVKFLGNNSRRSFTPKDVGNALLAAAREMSSEYDDSSTPPANPPAGNPPANPPAGNPPAGNPPSGTPPAGGGNPPSNGGGGLAGRLASLSAQDRATLLRLIS